MSAVLKSVPQAAPREVRGPLTDVYNAGRLAQRHAGRLAYCPQRGQWLEFDGNHWAGDEMRHVMQHAIQVTRDLLAESQILISRAMMAGTDGERDKKTAIAQGMLEWARKSQAKPRLDAMLGLAKTDPQLTVHQSKLDEDDMLLGVQNGVIDLETGAFRDGQAGDFITRQAGCEWRGDETETSCPRWEQFLAEIQPDPDVRWWLQKFIGYCLTGSTKEQIFPIFQGKGKNGKSVLMTIMTKLLGSYAETVQFDTFIENDKSAIRNDLAALDKVRLVFANEGKESARLDEGIIKQMTGGDQIRARFLHREFFTYAPRYKIVLVTNHRPVITGTDEGIWRRPVLVPFPTFFPPEKRDKDLDKKLLAELPGIMAWAMVGLLAWKEQGLELPRALALANAEYRQESDVVGLWIEDRCQLDDLPTERSEVVTPIADLYRDYEMWIRDAGHRPLSSKSLVEKLTERGHERCRDRRGNRAVRGIRLSTACDL
ncbi:DNA primase family protein [Thiomonas sp.]